MSEPCHRDGCEDTGSLRCSACRSAWYCHASCQKEDWEEHKNACRKIKTCREDKKHLPSNKVEENTNCPLELEMMAEMMLRKLGINVRLPRYHEEYASAFPQEKGNIARLAGDFRVATMMLSMVPEKPGLSLAGYGTLRQTLTKRWHFLSPELLVYLNSRPQPGQVCSFHPSLQKDHVLQYGQFHMLKNTAVHKILLQQGKHVSVGFVDLTQLLNADLALEEGGQVEWHGYDMNILVVARAKLILHLLKDPTCPDQVILQVWFSSLLSKEAETVARKACKKLAKQDTDMKPIFSYWAKAELSCKNAKTLWSHDIASCDLNTVGLLAKEVDRVFYAHYLFNGDLFLAGVEPCSGNMTLLSIPGHLDHLFSKQFDNFFHSFHTNTYSESLEMSAEKNTSVGLQKLRKYLVDGNLTVSIHLQKVDNSNQLVQAEIRNMAPLTVDWSNIPDFVPPSQFEKLARSVGVSHTTHTCHMMNWVEKMFGTSPLDFFPALTPSMMDQDTLDPSGKMDQLGMIWVAKWLEVLKKILPTFPFLLQEPTLHTGNFMVLAKNVLAYPFQQNFLRYYFSSGVHTSLKQPVPNMDRLNPFGRTDNILYVFFKVTDDQHLGHQFSLLKKAEERKEEGNQLYKMGKFEKALSKYTAAISLDPDRATLYGNRSACYLMLGRHQQALEDARMSIDIDPTFTKGWGRVARSCALLGDVQSARQALSTFEELGGDSSPELKYLEEAELKAVKIVGASYKQSGTREDKMEQEIKSEEADGTCCIV